MNPIALYMAVYWWPFWMTETWGARVWTERVNRAETEPQ